ncbi:hypothetical protein F4212_15465 [Candidatus Poribacteria bacterium]|nr:hypothetical protein [Candidatus Poribacteria bacterium]
MLTINQMFFGMLLPAIVCGSLFGTSVYLLNRDEQRRQFQWLVAAALGIGYIIGHIALEGRPNLLPKESIHWLVYFTLLAILTGTYWDSSRWIRLITQLIYSIAIPRLLLDSYFRYTWGPIEAVIWWICLTVGVYIFWNIVLQSFSALPSGASVPFVYLGISGGTTLITALSGTIVIALHAGIIAVLFAAIWILTIVLQRRVQLTGEFRTQVIPNSVSPVVTFLFVGVWINGYFYAEVPSVSVLLLLLSPVFAMVGRINAVQRLGERKTVLLQICLIALCVSIALIIAVIRSGLFGENTY